MTRTDPVYWDPFDRDIAQDPYGPRPHPGDHQGGRGDPARHAADGGPASHDIHRSLPARVFTPRRVQALEPRIRAYRVQALDRLVGAREFDLMAEFANEVPMRVIGMPLGIPEADQAAVPERADADLMTDLLHAGFEDADGVRRTLTRQEILTYVSVLAGAGDETTARLLGRLGHLLARHPDRRAELIADPALIPNAIEETLRFEPTGHAIARSVTRDVEPHGRTVPAGSAITLPVASANRDEAHWTDPDRDDIHRTVTPLRTFGIGPHFRLGAAPARLEARWRWRSSSSAFRAGTSCRRHRPRRCAGGSACRSPSPDRCLIPAGPCPAGSAEEKPWGSSRGKSPSSPVPPAARAAAMRSGWPRRAPT